MFSEGNFFAKIYKRLLAQHWSNGKNNHAQNNQGCHNNPKYSKSVFFVICFHFFKIKREKFILNSRVN